MDGLEVVRELKGHDPEAVVMVVTGFGTIETAVTAMQRGAYDFHHQALPPEVLRAKVDQGLELAGTRRQVQRLKATTRSSPTMPPGGGALVGSSEPMARLLALVRKPRSPTPRSSSTARAAPAKSWWRG